MFGHFDEIARGIGVTVAVTALSFAVGAVVALPLVAANRSRFLVVRTVTRFLIDLLRAVPPLVWLFLIFYGLAQGVITFSPYQAAVIGLGLVSAAYLAEVYRAGVLAVRRGQWEAAQALGLSRLQVLRWVIAPQAFLVVLPGAVTWAIALLKETSVVSIIGVTDITFHASSEAQRSGDSLQIFLLAGLIYIALSFPVAMLARWADRAVTRAVAAGAR